MPEGPRRGEVWLAALGNPIGHEAGFSRPVVVVSDDHANYYGMVTVCPVTRTDRGYPTRVLVPAVLSGLDSDSYAQGEQVRTVSTGRLVHRTGIAGIEAMHALDKALRWLLRL